MSAVDAANFEIYDATAPNAVIEWWRGAVIYQIYPRSFLDTNGDGVGDLRGVLKGLDYIARLGVDAIWLSPFFTSPMDDFGYDVADYRGVDPIFGDLADFDAIIDKAHTLGLKVIIDQVYSHTSDQHAWFQQSAQNANNAKADWYVWADPKPDGSPPNNWQSVFGGGAWEWHSARRQYYLHNFLTSQPDLNVHNKEVQDALLDVAKFWLDRGVDGFRLDALNFAMHDEQLRDNPPAQAGGPVPTRPFDYQEHRYNQSHQNIPKFLERIRALTDRYDGVFTVAEVGGPKPLDEMKAFTENGARLNSAYNFSFLYADNISATLAMNTLQEWDGAPGEGWPSWAFSNHDAPRHISRWAEGGDLAHAAKLYAMLLMSLRGNVFIYQGEELGLPQADIPFELLQDPEAIENWPFTLGRDGARTPIPWEKAAPNAGFTSGQPWLPIDEKHRELSIETQENDAGSVLNFFRRVLTLRKECAAIRLGDLTFYRNTERLLAFSRKYANEEAICVFNLTDTSSGAHPPLPDGLETIISVGSDAVKTGIPEPLPPLSGYIGIKKS